jgi:hypothetical protein
MVIPDDKFEIWKLMIRKRQMYNVVVSEGRNKI